VYRYFENHLGTSNKFWEITVDGGTTTAHASTPSGRRGRQGRRRSHRQVRRLMPTPILNPMPFPIGFGMGFF